MENHRTEGDLTDPVGLIRRLDPDTIRRRLAQMEQERRALLALLRAARANCKGEKEAANAS